MSTTRETGYYWVRLEGEQEWDVAYWEDRNWFFTASSVRHFDSDLDEIDERKIERLDRARAEYWKTLSELLEAHRDFFMKSGKTVDDHVNNVGLLKKIYELKQQGEPI